MGNFKTHDTPPLGEEVMGVRLMLDHIIPMEMFNFISDEAHRLGLALGDVYRMNAEESLAAKIAANRLKEEKAAKVRRAIVPIKPLGAKPKAKKKVAPKKTKKAVKKPVAKLPVAAPSPAAKPKSKKESASPQKSVRPTKATKTPAKKAPVKKATARKAAARPARKK